jgi:nucleoside-diphosphate-sugar epimerase
LAVTGDFREKERMEELLRGVDVVFHLASAHLQVSLKESEYWDINVHSLPALLELARRSGVQRFVHCSSVGTFGNLSQWPANEESLCRPQSIYGETKLAGEDAVLKFYERPGFTDPAAQEPENCIELLPSAAF